MERQAWGRNQPYTAAVNVADDATSNWKKMAPAADATKPLNTFYRHNAKVV